MIKKFKTRRKSKRISDEIDKQIKEEKKDHPIKVLLIGTDKQRIRTLSTQIKYEYGFTNEEHEKFKRIITGSVVSTMQTLIEVAREKKIAVNVAEQAIMFHQEASRAYGTLTPSLAKAIKVLWRDPGIKQACESKKDAELAGYFFDNIDRVGSPDFSVSQIDLLFVPTQNTGINDTKFTDGQVHFSIVSLEGLKSERRKWMHYFQNVALIVFCADIGGYELIIESIKAFELQCNSPWFIESSILLMLCNIELLKDKLQYDSLAEFFPDYQGGLNPVDVLEFISQQFTKQYNSSKKLYVRQSDGNDIEHMLNVARDLVLWNAIKSE